jgi:hypothetical protein
MQGAPLLFENSIEGGNMIHWILFLAQVIAGAGAGLFLQVLVAMVLGDQNAHCDELRACRAELESCQTEEAE